MLVAKGSITITELEDGFYSVRLAPSVILIPANADGSNPILMGAKSKVFVSKETVSIPVTVTSLSPTGCTATFVDNEVSITDISAQQGKIVIAFIAQDGYSSTIELSFLVSKQGESGITVILDNETHAVPANHDGTLPLGALDSARTKIMVFRGATELTAVGANATPGHGQFRYNVESVTGGTANRIDNNNVQLVNMTADNAVISIKVYVDGLSNVVIKQMTLSKMRGLDPAIVDRVIDWTFTGTEEFDGSKIRAKSIVAAAIDVINLFAQVVEATNLTVTGNSKIGPFFIGADGIFSSQSGSIINASTLKNSGFNWLYWNQLNYNRTAGLEIGKMGTDGILNIKASSNGGPEFTSGIVIDVGSGRKGLDLKTGDLAVPSGVGMTVKQPIITGYASNNPYSPIIKYLNIDKGIIVSITDN